MVTLGELVMILDLARQGLSVSAIARRTGHDRKTIRTYIARGLEPPAYKPRECGFRRKSATVSDLKSAADSGMKSAIPI